MRLAIWNWIIKLGKGGVNCQGRSRSIRNNVMLSSISSYLIIRPFVRNALRRASPVRLCQLYPINALFIFYISLGWSNSFVPLTSIYISFSFVFLDPSLSSSFGHRSPIYDRSRTSITSLSRAQNTLELQHNADHPGSSHEKKHTGSSIFYARWSTHLAKTQ